MMMLETGSAGDCGSLTGAIVGVVCLRECCCSGMNCSGVVLVMVSLLVVD